MRFIKLELIGGLGNQLFEYAMARGLMEKNDKLLFDTDNYKYDFYGRHFTLTKYRVKGERLHTSRFERFFNPHSKVNRFVNRLDLFTELKEQGFYIHKHVKEQMRTFTSVHGYWQSYRYFDWLKPQLQKEMVPVTKPAEPGIFQKAETVVIHVRRTDFLKDPRYGAIDKKYYEEAISTMKSLVKEPLFVFFSDDIDWCKQNFVEENTIFCDFPGWEADYHRLYLMTLCKHHVISNSSFSWWGAWLCNNPNQVVMRPANPFKDPSLLYEDHYPANWISVAN